MLEQSRCNRVCDGGYFAGSFSIPTNCSAALFIYTHKYIDLGSISSGVLKL